MEKLRSTESEVAVETKEKHSWELPFIEAILSLEPLLNRPQWFDEDHPRLIMSKMLKRIGAPKGTFARLKEAKDDYRSQPNALLQINEKMNPFRVTNLTTAFSSSRHALVVGKDITELQRHAFKILPISNGEIKNLFDEVHDKIAYRKFVGQRAEDIRKLILTEKESGSPREELIQEMEELRDLASRESKLSMSEVRRVYDLAKLAAYIIRDFEGRSNDNSLDTLVDNLKKPLKKIKEKDFSQIVADLQEKLKYQ